MALERSNSALVEFSYVVSHDLKEPLFSIIKNIDSLNYKLDEDGKILINNTLSITNRMKKLITDLLTYSMAGIHGINHLNDCNIIIEQVIKNLQVSIEENKAIITHDPLPNIIADPVRIEQLFQNLISNAIKYRREIPVKIHISVEYKNNMQVFSFKDNGIGILKEHKERIFNVFTRLHSENEYNGTGIGLAVCKKIIEHYGGNIWVDSKPGEGSVFYFSLPV